MSPVGVQVPLGHTDAVVTGVNTWKGAQSTTASRTVTAYSGLRRPQIVSGVPIASSAADQGFYTWAGRSILGRTRGTHEDHSLFRLKAAPPRVQYSSCSEKRTPG